ncbi:hypothetical protein AVEN_35580-1 [Araneus ventricosus]|uniref:Uncharacterized protein n=1 Tax=Araneus ventricosus TaxID=182803 RepID=A0A4Y2CJ69_ARAVE|nr:hypothetical protein AVEN_35580-1 [Araneus ventricosus]
MILKVGRKQRTINTIASLKSGKCYWEERRLPQKRTLPWHLGSIEERSPRQLGYEVRSTDISGPYEVVLSRWRYSTPPYYTPREPTTYRRLLIRKLVVSGRKEVSGPKINFRVLTISEPRWPSGKMSALEPEGSTEDPSYIGTVAR